MPTDFRTFAAVVAETFMTPIAAIKPETTAADVDGWDSISNTTLMVSIEERFGVRFTDDEIGGFENLGAMFERVVALTS
jgi:acyl carrier protein